MERGSAESTTNRGPYWWRRPAVARAQKASNPLGVPPFLSATRHHQYGSRPAARRSRVPFHNGDHRTYLSIRFGQPTQRRKRRRPQSNRRPRFLLREHPSTEAAPRRLEQAALGSACAACTTNTNQVERRVFLWETMISSVSPKRRPRLACGPRSIQFTPDKLNTSATVCLIYIYTHTPCACVFDEEMNDAYTRAYYTGHVGAAGAARLKRRIKTKKKEE